MDGLWDQIETPLNREGAQRVAAWVVPYWHSVVDLLCFASISAQDTDCPTSTRLACGGMVEATAWVQDLAFGPVTGRDEVPVTLSAARVETATADDFLHGKGPEAVRELCRSTGVRFRPPLDGLGRDFLMGAWVTLRWLTGLEELPPLQVPLRHANGSLATAAELNDSMLRDEPDADAARRAQMRRNAAAMAEESYSTARHIARGKTARQIIEDGGQGCRRD